MSNVCVCVVYSRGSCRQTKDGDATNASSCVNECARNFGRFREEAYPWERGRPRRTSHVFSRPFKGPTPARRGSRDRVSAQALCVRAGASMFKSNVGSGNGIGNGNGKCNGLSCIGAAARRKAVKAPEASSNRSPPQLSRQITERAPEYAHR